MLQCPTKCVCGAKARHAANPQHEATTRSRLRRTSLDSVQWLVRRRLPLDSSHTRLHPHGRPGRPGRPRQPRTPTIMMTRPGTLSHRRAPKNSPPGPFARLPRRMCLRTVPPGHFVRLPRRVQTLLPDDRRAARAQVAPHVLRVGSLEPLLGLVVPERILLRPLARALAMPHALVLALAVPYAGRHTFRYALRHALRHAARGPLARPLAAHARRCDSLVPSRPSRHRARRRTRRRSLPWSLRARSDAALPVELFSDHQVRAFSSAVVVVVE